MTVAALPAVDGPALRRAAAELGLLASLYLLYSVSRLFAADALDPAVERAGWLRTAESWVGLDVERDVATWVADHASVATAASFHYASAHYVVTVLAVLWAYRRGPAVYVPARRALVLATVVALVGYLLLPVAPPRLIDGYPDVLAMFSDVGWWGADASAPQGLGALTNELAAFPSMHAGWALWVALLLQRHAPGRGVPALGWVHAVGTALVVVATGNHWVVDVLAGWVVVWAACRFTPARADASASAPVPPPAPTSPARTAAAPAGRRGPG